MPPPRRTAPLFTTPPVRKGMWFPLVLGLMLLLAVPGMIFLALSLLGKETAVNGWMREHFGLSYHIPIPWWAGLILLLIPFFILLLYFLKMKRKPLQVPSTYLWKKSIEDLHVNSLFQWMRDNALLLVQLLIVLLLIYAVMAFQVYGAQGTGRHYILLIDNSASMAVVDAEGGSTRLAAAKQAALNAINAHGEGDVGMVIEFNSNAVIRQPYTVDRDKLRLAVGGVEQTNRATHIEEALNLADSLANPTRSTANQAVTPENVGPGQAKTYVDVKLESVPAEVHLYSDGRFPDVAGFAAGALDLNYHRIGAADDTDNVGIVTLNAWRDDKGTSNLRVFLRVLNFRGREVETRVQLDELDWKDGELKVVDSHIKPVTINPLTVSQVDADKKETPTRTPGEKDVIFDLTNIDDSSNRVLRASLLDLKDAFPLDDQAWLVVGVVRKARVLIVTDGNEILHNFFDLDATQKVAVVSYLTSADLKDEAKYLRPAAGAFDLVVFDRFAPENEEAMPLGNTYFIGDVPPPWKWADLADLKDAQIRNPTSKHPLMDHLTGLDEIAFGDAKRFELDPDKNPGVPPRVPKLMETDREGAVLFALPRRSFTDLVQTFPLVNSKGQWTTNWNLKLSFPLFLRNVLYQLGNVADSAAEENLQPGQIKALRPDVAVKDGGDPADAGVKEVKVWDEANRVSHTLQPGPSKDFLYKDTEDIGVYLATWEGGRRGFTVNLLDENESDIRPREEVKIGEQVLASGPTHGQPSDLWPWAALAALVLLIVEWVLYHFRVFG